MDWLKLILQAASAFAGAVKAAFGFAQRQQDVQTGEDRQTVVDQGKVIADATDRARIDADVRKLSDADELAELRKDGTGPR